MKKTFVLITGVAYILLVVTGILFLNNHFTDSVETNYIFKVVAYVLFNYTCTYPLVLAGSDNLKWPIWAKVILYAAFVAGASLILYYSFRITTEKDFGPNILISEEEYKEYQEDYILFWIVAIISNVGFLAVFIAKPILDFEDIHDLWLVPFTPIISVIAVAVLIIHLVFALLGGVLALIGSTSGESSPEDSSSSDTSSGDNGTEEKESEEEEEKEEKHYNSGYYRQPGDAFYDAKGYYRQPGDAYYDAQGYYRQPGDAYYDYQGYYRQPGDPYYDSEGYYRQPGDPYYDGGGDDRTE